MVTSLDNINDELLLKLQREVVVRALMVLTDKVVEYCGGALVDQVLY